MWIGGIPAIFCKRASHEHAMQVFDARTPKVIRSEQLHSVLRRNRSYVPS
jgi:hypothetical protein